MSIKIESSKNLMTKLPFSAKERKKLSRGEKFANMRKFSFANREKLRVSEKRRTNVFILVRKSFLN